MTNGKANTPIMVTRSFQLPLELEQQIKALAAREHRTFSQEMRRLIELRLAEVDLDRAA